MGAPPKKHQHPRCGRSALYSLIHASRSACRSSRGFLSRSVLARAASTAALYSDVAPEARSSFLNFGPIFGVVGHGHSRISSGRLRGHRVLLQGGDQFAQNPIRHCYATNHNCVVPRVAGAAN